MVHIKHTVCTEFISYNYHCWGIGTVQTAVTTTASGLRKQSVAQFTSVKKKSTTCILFNCTTVNIECFHVMLLTLTGVFFVYLTYVLELFHARSASHFRGFLIGNLQDCMSKAFHRPDAISVGCPKTAQKINESLVVTSLFVYELQFFCIYYKCRFTFCTVNWQYKISLSVLVWISFWLTQFLYFIIIIIIITVIMCTFI